MSLFKFSVNVKEDLPNFTETEINVDLVDRLRQSYLPQSSRLSSALSSIAPCILNLTATSPATGKPGFGWANEKKTRHAMAVPNARNSSGRKSLGAG